MKKKIAALMAGLMMAASTVCFASIPGSSIALEGVAPGSSVEAAKAKLGTPNYAGDKLYFPNGIMIDVADYNPSLVDEIETRQGGHERICAV